MAKITAKYKMDSSTDTITLYLADGTDSTLTNLAALIEAGVVESYTGTVDGASYTGYKFIDQIVVNEGIADELITTAKIADLAISTDKLKDLLITAGKIAAGQIDWSTHMSGAASQPEDYASDNRTSIPSTVQLDGTGTALSSIDTAATNFNNRNDRDATAITSPVIAADGTAIDHVANTDGSCDISFEWTWAGANEDIDGFIVFLRNSTSSASYNFGTTVAEEQAWSIPAVKRAFIFYGMAINKYYTFGVQAYRHVDPDINAAEIIKSSLIQCSLAAEDPYRPASNATFAGDITGTLNGSAFGALASESVVTADFVGAGMIAVGTAAIAAGAIATVHIGNAQITNALIDNLAVNDAKIADLSANKINAGTLSAARIAAGSLDASKITTDTITATQISGTQLDVLASNMGTLSVDETLTVASGGVFKSGMTAAATGSGYWIDNSGGTARAYLGTGAAGTMTTGLSVVGSTTTVFGDLIATGNVNANGITKTSASQTDTASQLSTDTNFQSVTTSGLDTSSPVLVLASFYFTARTTPSTALSLNIYIRKNTTDELLLGSLTYASGPGWAGLAPIIRVTGMWWDTSAGSATPSYHIRASGTWDSGTITVDDRIIIAMQTKR